MMIIFVPLSSLRSYITKYIRICITRSLSVPLSTSFSCGVEKRDCFAYMDVSPLVLELCRDDSLCALETDFQFTGSLSHHDLHLSPGRLTVW